MDAQSYPRVRDTASFRSLSVSVRFGGLLALSDVSLRMGEREILGLIGPNGAGKTTLVNVLTGFQRPSAGKVVLDDANASRWDPGLFRSNGISRTFQAGRLFKRMSVRENVEVAAVSQGRSRRQARAEVSDILDWLGIADLAGKSAETLPYTDQRRVEIARALVGEPRFLLLDEPAAGMSDRECDDLIAVVRRIPIERRCSVLLIEHNFSLVMDVCDRVHVLDGGRTLAEGAPAEIRSHRGVIDAYLGAQA